jgi:hypothetical protein
MRTTKAILVVIGVAIMAAGCVTTGTRHDEESQQLQSRISDLESELQSKDREIDELERALAQQPGQPMAAEKPRNTAPVTKLSNKQIQTALKNAGFTTVRLTERSGKKPKQRLPHFRRPTV